MNIVHAVLSMTYILLLFICVIPFNAVLTYYTDDHNYSIWYKPMIVNNYDNKLSQFKIQKPELSSLGAGVT